MADKAAATTISTHCCIVGAGPAGAMLGLLLARRGVPVVLLESHFDFDRDFRGDTVHPSTLEILDQLGLAERVLQMPHGVIRALRMHTRNGEVMIADLSRLRSKFPFVAMLPQTQLLELLADEAKKKYPHFQLIFGANVQRLIEDSGVVRGVAYCDKDNRWHDVRADLTVACDGRFSKIRHLIGVEPIKTAPPMDIVWFRLPRFPSDSPSNVGVYVGRGHFAVVLDRGDEWQIAYVILKGSFAAVREQGIAALREGLVDAVHWLADRVDQLQDWKQVAVLNVESSRIPTWHRPGLLLIGDAAHVMSPVGGVGINYAIQDAVETANMLAEKLRHGPVADADLAAVQRRREFPVRVIQRVQRLIQDRIAAPGLDSSKPFRPPWFLRFIAKIPGLRVLPGRLLAIGIRRVSVEGNEESPTKSE